MTFPYVAFDPDMLHSPLPFGIQAYWQGSVGSAQDFPPILISFDTLTFCRLCGAPSRCAIRGLFVRLLGQGDTPLKEDIFWTNVLLAGRCLASRPTIWQSRLREEVISRLLHTLTHTQYSLIQELTASVLAEVGGGEVNTNLIRLLADEQLDSGVRESIADALGTLGERTVAPDLVRLLADEQLHSGVRRKNAHVLGNLTDDNAMVYALATFLEISNISDDVYTALWKVSRRVGLRVLMTDTPEGKTLSLLNGKKNA
jgi:hypothetical protein